MNILIFIYSLHYVYYQLFLFTYSRIGETKVRRTYDGGISIIIPSYDEVYTIQKCIDSIIDSDIYFDIEIIVVDDGKDSATLDCLKRRCEFYINDYKKIIIDDSSIRNVYKGIYRGKDIYVIDKENEGKSKALNCAIKVCKYDYYIGIDADSLVDKNSIKSLYEKINDETIAIGGCIIPIDNNSNFKEALLVKYQKYEYLVNFNYARVSFNCLRCVPLLSGAFSLYKKQAVIDAGGYSSKTKGEDFDLSLKLQEFQK